MLSRSLSKTIFFVIIFLSVLSCKKESGFVAVTGVSLDRNSAELPEGESLSLVATVNPSGVTNKNVTWELSDRSVAMVDASGNKRSFVHNCRIYNYSYDLKSLIR